MEYSKEFKKALSEFSSVEKDRLIFRLLKKDRILSHKLYFELIDPQTEDEKRAAMEILIADETESAAKYLRNPKYFLVLIRKISAKITEHVKITTDRFGDVSLNLLLINEILSKSDNFRDAYKLYIYLLNKIFKVLILTEKLDPDYYIELESAFETLNDLMVQNKELAPLATLNGLDFNWLKPENIPEQITLIQKNIKSEGFLR